PDQARSARASRDVQLVSDASIARGRPFRVGTAAEDAENGLWVSVLCVLCVIQKFNVPPTWMMRAGRIPLTFWYEEPNVWVHAVTGLALNALKRSRLPCTFARPMVTRFENRMSSELTRGRY